ncbi:MAG: adenylate/guanylate cyclase domain-containing protein [Burkholderiales bacterium]|nr:adenylate/guanylate cyclase domain-containing protein [Burkholderiales bacterium]
MTNVQNQAVLFADVSGSTRLYERLGDRIALALIERCVDAMQGVTRRHRGTVVKTIGDEIMAVFSDVAVACRAAMDMQIAVCTLPEAIEHGLTIHCGFHFGEVMVADDDVFGDTVNVAKRLSEVSKAGQIVTSGEVVRMLPAELTESTRFLDSEQVKGRAAPLELFEVLWEPDVELTEVVTGASWKRPQLKVSMRLAYRGREYRVDDQHPAISLGRDARAEIPLFDKLASRNHCRVEKTRNKFTFLDFSSNGTYVKMEGREEILVRRESVVLQDSGTISFGRPVASDPESAVSFEVIVKT